MRKLALVAAVAAAQVISGPLPDLYRTVDTIVWVLEKPDDSVAAWRKAGIVQVQDRTDNAIMGQFGDVRCLWVRPGFAGRRTEGVLGLLHAVPDVAALDAEVERIRGLGVGVLKRGRLPKGTGDFVLFDTVRDGKYAVGLVRHERPPDTAGAAHKVSQFAFIVKDHGPVSKYWARLGWPELSVTEPSLSEMTYQGGPSSFGAKLGWQRHGKVVYEWILPVAGPSAWHDHLRRTGEGFHHFGINVPDMDAALTAWKQAGFTNVQAGAWGEKGKKGSGRFAYLSYAEAGGVDVELLWNYK
jgi:catechol 2,3-dioxygenase-like lactoylglutathione lyase family enzyme